MNYEYILKYKNLLDENKENEMKKKIKIFDVKKAGYGAFIKYEESNEIKKI